MGTNTLSLRTFDTAEEAIAAGYDYNQHRPVPQMLSLDEAVVVRRGTQAGNPTVDFILRDQDGKTYVTAITGALLAQLPLVNR